MNKRRLTNEIKLLSIGYMGVELLDERNLLVHGFKLPPGYNHDTISIIVELPEDYPISPPGVANSGVFVPSDLRFKGKKISKDMHDGVRGAPKGWSWMCFRDIKWNSKKDDLKTFFEMLRTCLTEEPLTDKEPSVIDYIRQKNPGIFERFLSNLFR